MVTQHWGFESRNRAESRSTRHCLAAGRTGQWVCRTRAQRRPHRAGRSSALLFFHGHWALCGWSRRMQETAVAGGRLNGAGEREDCPLPPPSICRNSQGEVAREAPAPAWAPQSRAEAETSCNVLTGGPQDRSTGRPQNLCWCDLIWK